jgi:hypothetical protein
VHDLVLGGIFDVEMREVQSADGVESALKSRVHLPAAMRRPQLGSHLPQGPEHPSPVKPLSLTVFAEVLHGLSTPAAAFAALDSSMTQPLISIHAGARLQGTGVRSS